MVMRPLSKKPSQAFDRTSDLRQTKVATDGADEEDGRAARDDLAGGQHAVGAGGNEAFSDAPSDATARGFGYVPHVRQIGQEKKNAPSATVTSTAWLITRPPTRIFSYRASSIRYSQPAWSSRRSRKTDNFSSSSAATRLTVAEEMSNPHIASNTFCTLRVLTP
jgi:hypothetical protein